MPITNTSDVTYGFERGKHMLPWISFQGIFVFE